MFVNNVEYQDHVKVKSNMAALAYVIVKAIFLTVSTLESENLNLTSL